MSFFKYLEKVSIVVGIRKALNNAFLIYEIWEAYDTIETCVNVLNTLGETHAKEKEDY